MSAFDKVWGAIKKNDDYEQPDKDFHQLNDPNPTIAFGAAIRNNPIFAEMMRQREEGYEKPYSEGGYIHECQNCGKETDINYDDVYDDKFCSNRCADGKNPTCYQLTGNECKYVIDEQPEYNRELSQHYESSYYDILIKCPICEHYMYGSVSE